MNTAVELFVEEVGSETLLDNQCDLVLSGPRVGRVAPLSLGDIRILNAASTLGLATMVGTQVAL